MHRPASRSDSSGVPGLRRWLWLAAAIGLAMGLPGCATGAPPAAHPPTTVGVVLQDFKISSGATRVAAGKVSFIVANNGPETHEFNVDRTSLGADALPIDSTGLAVNEASPQLQRQGSVESEGLGTTRRLTLDMKPGHYVFYCDLPGHYMSGMRVSLDVY